MIQVTFIIEQLNIQQIQSVQGFQRIDVIIRNLLYKAEIDLSDWENFQCQIQHNNFIYGCDRTFNELNVTNQSILFIKLSKAIRIEVLNKQLPYSQYNVDAFDRIKQYKEWITKNYLGNNTYEITIINTTDGRFIEKETWIQNSIQDYIQVFLYINVKQTILWQGNSIVQEINIFSSIAKLIYNLKNQLKINNIITLEYQNRILIPESLYFNYNIPPKAQLVASIPNQLIYRISFEKQKQEKKITCDTNQLIKDVIKQLRIDFSINSTSQLLLEYKWTLNIKNTFEQEDIPNFSLLKLIEEESQGEFQIILQNIDENEVGNEQIEIVNNETTLKDLSRKIPHEINEYVINFLDEQGETLDHQLKMEDLNIYYGAKIMYKIINKPQINTINTINTINKQVEQKKIGILVVNINTVINIDFCMKYKISALTEALRQKLAASENQLFKFSIGTQLLNDDDNINEIFNGKFEYLQVYLLETIDVYLLNTYNNSKSLITVRLEDTLKELAQKQNIQSKFKKNGQDLGIDETFLKLKIFHKTTITYEKIISKYIIANAKIGGIQCKFQISSSITFENLKKEIYKQVMQGVPGQLGRYSLFYEDQPQTDDVVVSSLNKNEIDIQLKLKQDFM